MAENDCIGEYVQLIEDVLVLRDYDFLRCPWFAFTLL